jgi:hypothetical protein
VSGSSRILHCSAPDHAGEPWEPLSQGSVPASMEYFLRGQTAVDRGAGVDREPRRDEPKRPLAEVIRENWCFDRVAPNPGVAFGGTLRIVLPRPIENQVLPLALSAPALALPSAHARWA